MKKHKLINVSEERAGDSPFFAHCFNVVFLHLLAPCYTFQDMRYLPSHVYSLVLHDDAKADLTRIRQLDEAVAADIEVFLEEAKNNQETLDNLTRKGYVDHGDVPFNVDDWGEARRLKYNLWRIKFLFVKGPASKYRIIYAFHTIEYRYYVLGIVDRDFGYKVRDERSEQILAAYDALDIPRH